MVTDTDSNDTQAESSMTAKGLIQTQSANEDGYAQDEETPLLAQNDTRPKSEALTGVGAIIAVLLLGKLYRKPMKFTNRSERRMQVNLFPMPTQHL